MRRIDSTPGDLAFAVVAAVGVHALLLWMWVLDLDPSVGVSPGRTSVEVDLVANTVAAAETTVEAPSEPERLPGPEPVALPDVPGPEGTPAAPIEERQAGREVPLDRIPAPHAEPSPPQPAARAVEGNSDANAAARLAGAEAAPLYASNPPPRYPESARARGIAGVSTIEVLVRADGTAGEVRLAESSGNGALDDAAVAAVRGWRFRPAMRGGIAVESRVLCPVRFQLK